MASPQLTVYSNGIGSLSGDGLNTFEQTCDTAAQLRAFVGVSGIQVYMRGQSSVSDGYQGAFYWNASATSPTDDNGVTTIVPNGFTVGCWSRITPLSTLYSYQSPATGFSIVIPNNVSELILSPAATLATGTIIMPTAPTDGLVVSVSSTQIITALTVSANVGQTIFNAPSTLAAGGHFSYRYVLSLSSWFVA